MTRRRVLIYRRRLLPISQTFVRQHYDSLTSYEPVFAGLEEVEGISVADTRRILLQPSPGRLDQLRFAVFKGFGYGPTFLEAVRQCKPDLIHAHFLVDAVDMVPVARRLDVPLIVTMHGFDATMHNLALVRKNYLNFLMKRQRLFKEGSLFLAVSDYIRREAVRKGCPQEKAIVHYLGIDLSTFPANRSGERENVILFVGRLVPKKGLDYLIKATARASRVLSQPEIRVIGEGPSRNELETLAREKGVNAQFLGSCTHDQVLQEMQRATVLSLPSVAAASGDNEGLGLVLLEAQAMGVPVVAFAQGPIPEAVKHEETGFLAPPRDVRKLSEYLSRCLVDEALRRRLGECGKRFVRSTFDLSHQAKVLEGIYDNAVADYARGHG